MATSISINTLSDDSNGVGNFITLAASNTILTNNLVRASTLRRIFNDNRFYSTIIQDGAIPVSKISGSIGAGSIATQSLSGAIGKDLNPARNGQIAWYTITQENLAHNTIFWNSSRKVGINNSNPQGTEALFIGGDDENTGLRISKWTSIKTRDGTGRVNWYANAESATFNNTAGAAFLNSNEGASRILQSLGEITFCSSNNVTPVAGDQVNWVDTLLLTKDGAVVNNKLTVAGDAFANAFTLQNSTGSIVYDSTNQSVGFNRGTTRVLDLYTDKAIFSKENMTIGSQANRIINNGYGIFDRITASNNIVYYRVSTTTLLNGQGDAQRDILTATPSNGRVGIGGDPDTIGSAALKVTGVLNVTSDINAQGNVTAYASSDRRLKDNIFPIQNALEKINSISGVTFNWTDEYINSKGGIDEYFLRKQDVGVIAQEVQKVLPEIVAEQTDGYLAVRYEKICTILIEAVKELTKKVEELEKKLA